MLNVAIKNKSTCDECKNEIEENKELYCKECYEELLYENNELKKEIEKLKDLQKSLDRISSGEIY